MYKSSGYSLVHIDYRMTTPTLVHIGWVSPARFNPPVTGVAVENRRKLGDNIRHQQVIYVIQAKTQR
jgi:hypothetical protein